MRLRLRLVLLVLLMLRRLVLMTEIMLEFLNARPVSHPEVLDPQVTHTHTHVRARVHADILHAHVPDVTRSAHIDAHTNVRHRRTRGRRRGHDLTGLLARSHGAKAMLVDLLLQRGVGLQWWHLEREREREWELVLELGWRNKTIGHRQRHR